MPEFKRPHALADVTTHYCPGCTHGKTDNSLALSCKGNCRSVQECEECSLRGDVYGSDG